YRMRLNGKWGVVDVDDCVNAALYLANKKIVNRDILIIRGGSAGGYTTLSALAFRNAFKAGASYYGISDLDVFTKDTHKFESRYGDFLIGPYPERRNLYHERSALYSLDKITAPVIFFQGLEDKVVPPNQAELLFNALKKKGVPTAYIAYEGEQHGFRQAKNIIRSYEAELYFYSKIFGIGLPEKIEPVKIENLSR
ncbi:MAG TPA: prolyl oligopeptidase family serine peptidase, partial [Nitrososphaerales archaeon]|nr:prolyl oligopeptidase family serine peptidase [Nitrososphaerales archaeon]